MGKNNFATYSDIIMKKDLYHEYKQEIDRYKPIADIQKEMSKINLKYILQTYLRVRNLCDQGIDDPDDVAEILNIPQYMASDLVEEYYLIPEKFDRRKQVFSRRNFSNIELDWDDPRLSLVKGLPFLVAPTAYLKDPKRKNATARDCAYYVGFLTFYWLEQKLGIIDSCLYRWRITEPQYEDTEVYNDIVGGNEFFEHAFNIRYTLLSEKWKKVNWVSNLYNEIVSRTTVGTEHQDKNLDRPRRESPVLDRKIRQQYPGISPQAKNKIV